MTDNWTLRQRVVALVAVVGVLLVGLAAAAAVVAAKNRADTDAVLNKTGPLRVQAQELLNALVDQESGVRGYALSGDRADLAPYDDGVRRERDVVAAMGRLLGGYPEIRRQVGVVQQEAARWRQTVAEPVIAATAQRGTDAGQALLTDDARQRFDQIRASAVQVQESIQVARQKTGNDVKQTGNLLVLLLVVAALVVVLAGATLLIWLDRMVVRPVTGLAEQVRGVAEGDYERKISSIGPPEFVQLAGDVDAMRRRIAADLAEVREARGRIEWVNSQLQKQTEELVRSNRDLEQFAYVASHDLQEPLRKVASFCQLLQRRYEGKLDERADQYIAFAVDGAQRMQRLINDLLAFSRIGRLTSGFTEVDLTEVMGDVAAQTEAARQYADGELTWSDLPMVRGEEPLLTNLLANLVSNSLKFRRPDVPPRVHISARRVGDEWEITCQDNGIGIEPEFADKIFVIFQRLHSKDAYPGTGIGLAIVKKIVEYHGGRVWVDTDVAEGTAIRFTLPALTDAEVEAARDPGPQPGGAAGAPDQRGPADEGATRSDAAADGETAAAVTADEETAAAPTAGAGGTPGDGATNSDGDVKETVA